jgi:hypothetical protein
MAPTRATRCGSCISAVPAISANSFAHLDESSARKSATLSGVQVYRKVTRFLRIGTVGSHLGRKATNPGKPCSAFHVDTAILFLEPFKLD